MQYIIQDDKIIYNSIKDFDLAETFLCGQTFRFDKFEDGFKGIIKGNICYLTLQKEILTVQLLNSTPSDVIAKEIYHFLALDFDYGALKERFSKDATMKKTIAYAEGIRVLNQDFFEMLITFIVSQNNNIPRIKKLVDLLSEKYGTKTCGIHLFPTAEQLSNVTEEDYREMKFGFRASYLRDAVSKITSGEVNESVLKSLRKLSPYTPFQ